VDHQVQHHRDVEVAVRGRAAADGFQAQRLLGDVQQAHGLEHHALLVAAGQRHAGLGGGGDQGVGVVRRHGQGLFGIDRLAGLQRRQAGLGVVHGGGGDGDHVDGGQEGGHVVEGLARPAARPGPGPAPGRRRTPPTSSTPSSSTYFLA
jgi:hypothetical protein